MYPLIRSYWTVYLANVPNSLQRTLLEYSRTAGVGNVLYEGVYEARPHVPRQLHHADQLDTLRSRARTETLRTKGVQNVSLKSENIILIIQNKHVLM